MSLKFSAAFIAGVTLAVSFGVQAASVDLVPNNEFADQGDTVTLRVVGSGFDQDADAGAFGATWDASVLTYVRTDIIAPPWDTTFVDDAPADTAAGTLKTVFLGASNNAGMSFDVADLVFTAVGDPGDVTTVQLAIDEFDSGWFAPGAVLYTTVDYGSATVTINPIPVPAAVWLFGSALGLLGWMRRRQIS